MYFNDFTHLTNAVRLKFSVSAEKSILAPGGHMKGYVEEDKFVGSIVHTLTLTQTLGEHVTLLLTCT